MANIAYVTDMNMGSADPSEKSVARSGYSNIGVELCRHLVKIGHNVKIMGLGYTGQEHSYEFSIIPCSSPQDAVGYMGNIHNFEPFDVCIVALDIHNFQEQIFPAVKKANIPYIAITPLESDPLCTDWANLLSQMDDVFFISQLGADEAVKAGVDKAKHIHIGIDTDSWRLRTEEEYSKARKMLGYTDDDFVVITVADNQERKDISGGFEALSKLKEKGVSVKHILVTREQSMVGWRLYSLAYEEEIDLASDLTIFQSGMPFEKLYALYCAADVYMSCSKGEGLGMPILESMAIGIPVVAQKTGALPELLAENRGWLVDHIFEHYDPFGNQKRRYVDRDKMAETLLEVKNTNPKILNKTLLAAREYVEKRNWSIPANQLSESIENIKKEA